MCTAFITAEYKLYCSHPIVPCEVLYLKSIGYLAQTVFIIIIIIIIIITNITTVIPCEVGPCHHGMARPQVADGGMASDMEGSCE